MATKPHSDKNYAVVIKMNAINNFVLFLFIRKGVGLIHDYFFIQKIKLWVALLIFEGLQAVVESIVKLEVTS